MKKAIKELEKQKKTEAFVCALCPDMGTEGLVRIGEKGKGKGKGLSAHRVCVCLSLSLYRIDHVLMDGVGYVYANDLD